MPADSDDKDQKIRDREQRIAEETDWFQKAGPYSRRKAAAIARSIIEIEEREEREKKEPPTP